MQLALARGDHGVLVGEIAGRVTTTPLADVSDKQKPRDRSLIGLADVLAQ